MEEWQSVNWLLPLPGIKKNDMHEMSIAQSIVDLAEEQARNRGSLAVEELELEIGRLAGVELQTLAFALESAVKGSMLEQATIIRHIIDGEGQCTDCRHTFPMEALFASCPECGSYCVKIIKGKELRVKSIVIK